VGAQGGGAAEGGDRGAAAQGRIARCPLRRRGTDIAVIAADWDGLVEVDQVIRCGLSGYGIGLPDNGIRAGSPS